jgi:hypothetical protein
VLGQFCFVPKKLATFDDILTVMHEIKLHSQALALRLLFHHHTMKILLIFYLMYIKEKINDKKIFKNKKVGYVLILDPSLDDILGKKKSIIRDLAQEFGLYSKEDEPRNKMAVFKKKRAYVFKLQEDPIFSSIPVLSNFIQIQITKKYCQATLNKVFIDAKENKNISTVQDKSSLMLLDFYEEVFHNLWSHMESTRSNCGFTRVQYMEFKSQMEPHLDTLVSLCKESNIYKYNVL